MFFQGHPDRNHKLWNTLSTKRNCKDVINEKLCKISICCFSESQPAIRCKSGWIGISILCPSGATCLPINCCFNKLALLKFYNQACWSGKKRTPSSSHRNVTCARHDIAELLRCWHLTTITIAQNQRVVIKVGSSKDLYSKLGYKSLVPVGHNPALNRLLCSYFLLLWHVCLTCN
jgi:hypothetical protein